MKTWCSEMRVECPQYPPLINRYYTYLCQGLFDGKWHQLKLLVRPPQLSSFLDDRLVRKLSLDPVDPIYINGKTQLSKRPGSDVTVPVSMKSSAPFYHRWLLKKKKHKKNQRDFPLPLLQVDIQKLRVYCDPLQSERETACEIPSVVSSLFRNSFSPSQPVIILTPALFPAVLSLRRMTNGYAEHLLICQ